MVNGRRSEDTGDGVDGKQDSDRSDGGDTVFFDVADVSPEETDWLPGPDYTQSIREAKRGEHAVRRLLRRVSRHGTRVRTKAWCTRDGEPVTRVDLHPAGWLELEARIRDLEERAANGNR